MSAGTCGACRHFGPATYITTRVFVVNGLVPIETDSKRKTTGCFLMPEIVEKKATDHCGQFAERRSQS